MSPRILYYTIFPIVWLACWLLVAGVSLETRPLIIGPEQVYLSTAWWSHQSADLLFPGQVVPDAPLVWPVVPWLINGGWAVFGVTTEWPRLIGYGAGLGCVFLVAGFARLLWPGWTGLGAMSGTTVGGFLVWLITAATPGPVTIAGFFVLSSLYFLVWSWRTGRQDGFIYFGVFTGLTVLTIGVGGWLAPVFITMSAPLWGSALAEQIDDDRSPPDGWRRWYIWSLVGLVLSVLMVLGWLIGGLLQDLTEGSDLAGHVFGVLAKQFTIDFSLRENWWGLVGCFVVAFLPWVFWMPSWRALSEVKHLFTDGGARLCILWASIVTLPFVALETGTAAEQAGLVIPPVAIVLAFLVFHRADREVRDPEEDSRFGNGETVLGLMTVLAGAALIIVPFSHRVFEIPDWIAGLNGGWGAVVMILGALVAYAAPRLVDLRMMIVSVLSALLMVLGTLATEPVLRSSYDPEPAANFARDYIEQGNHLAIYGQGLHTGVLDFAARLQNKPEILLASDPVGTAAWLATNPGGLVVSIMGEIPSDPQPLEVFPYGQHNMVFWLGETLIKHSGLLDKALVLMDPADTKK